MNRKKVLILYLIISMLMTLSGCGIDAMNNSAVSKVSDKQITEEMAINYNSDSFDNLEIANGVGNVNFTSTDDSKINVAVKKTVKGKNSEEIKRISKNIRIKALTENGKITIKSFYSDQDLWKWKRSNYKNDIILDFAISVPSRIRNFSINLGVGDANIKNISGQILVDVGVGDIKGNNIIAETTSIFNTGTGQIDLNFSDLSKSDLIKIHASEGDITIGIPPNSPCILEKHAYMEDTKYVGNQGPRLILNADLGHIYIKDY